MKNAFFAAALVMSLAAPVAPLAAQSNTTTSLGSVTIRHKVTAEGQPLAPGTYQVRLSNDEVQPVAGQTPGSERYVEFVRAGKVVAKAMATVVPDSEIKTIAKGPQPPRGGSRVDLLKGNDYVRVWINRGGNNYMIHLPAAPAA
jgi:hypothetical protein